MDMNPFYSDWTWDFHIVGNKTTTQNKTWSKSHVKQPALNPCLVLYTHSPAMNANEINKRS